MSTNWADAVAKMLPALVPLVTAIFAATRGPGGLRSRLKHDAELVEKLPESKAREALLDLVNEDVSALRAFDTGERQLPTAGFAFIAAIAFGYATVWLIELQYWWVYPVAALTGITSLACVYGIFESAQRVPRDENGKRLQPTALSDNE